jgi:hypothetical protein
VISIPHNICGKCKLLATTGYSPWPRWVGSAHWPKFKSQKGSIKIGAFQCQISSPCFSKDRSSVPVAGVFDTIRSQLKANFSRHSLKMNSFSNSNLNPPDKQRQARGLVLKNANLNPVDNRETMF